MRDRPPANRVMPDGRIVADEARGLFRGNRGFLEDGAGRGWSGARRPRPRSHAALRGGVGGATRCRRAPPPCAACRHTDDRAFRTARAAAQGARPHADDEAALHPSAQAQGTDTAPNPSAAPRFAAAFTRACLSMTWSGAIIPEGAGGVGFAGRRHAPDDRGARLSAPISAPISARRARGCGRAARP